MTGDDKVTVGVSNEGDRCMNEILEETQWFASGLDLYRTAVSVAIANDLVTDAESMGRVTTKYNVGSLDPNKRLYEMVTLLAPDRKGIRPYEYIERAADAGMKYLYQELVTNRKMLSTILTGGSGSAKEEQVHD